MINALEQLDEDKLLKQTKHENKDANLGEIRKNAKS